MRLTTCFLAIMVAGLFIAGCEGDSGTKAMDIAKDAIPTGAKKTEGTAAPADKPAAAEKPAASEKPAAAAADASKEAAAEEAAAKEAQTLIDQASAAIKDGKLDQAQELLGRLDGMKGSLPKSMQDKIGSLQKSLDSAKALKVPSGSAK